MKLYGVEVDEGREEKSQLLPKPCSRCDEVNPSSNKFCQRCTMPLDPEDAAKLTRVESDRSTADQVLDRLLEDEEFKRLLVEKVKGLFDAGNWQPNHEPP